MDGLESIAQTPHRISMSFVDDVVRFRKRVALSTNHDHQDEARRLLAEIEKLTQQLLHHAGHPQQHAPLHQGSHLQQVKAPTDVDALIYGGRLMEAVAVIQSSTRNDLIRMVRCAQLAIHQGDLETACSVLLTHTDKPDNDTRELMISSRAMDLLTQCITTLAGLAHAQRLASHAEQAVRYCDQYLDQIAVPVMSAGVRLRWICMKARALMKMSAGHVHEAIQVLTQGLSKVPQGLQVHTCAIWLLSKAYMLTNKPELAFEHLHALQASDMVPAGVLAAALRHAAQATLSQQQRSARQYKPGAASRVFGGVGGLSGVTMTAAVLTACDVLGIGHEELVGLRQGELERRYRRQAAQCHPDRLAGGGEQSDELTEAGKGDRGKGGRSQGGALRQEEGRSDASAFIAVRRAFECLTDFLARQ